MIGIEEIDGTIDHRARYFERPVVVRSNVEWIIKRCVPPLCLRSPAFLLSLPFGRILSRFIWQRPKLKRWLTVCIFPKSYYCFASFCQRNRCLFSAQTTVKFASQDRLMHQAIPPEPQCTFADIRKESPLFNGLEVVLGKVS